MDSEKDYSGLLISIMIILTLMIFRLGKIEDLLEEHKNEKVKQANYELQLWNEYRAEKEKR